MWLFGKPSATWSEMAWDGGKERGRTEESSTGVGGAGRACRRNNRAPAAEHAQNTARRTKEGGGWDTDSSFHLFSKDSKGNLLP